MLRNPWPLAPLLALALAGCAGASECGDRCQAVRRLGPACDAGDAEACFSLARALTYGGNTFGEPDAAARHERACELGHVEACGWAGMFFRDGPGFDDPEPARAMRAYDRGCDLGDPDQCHQAALLRIHGPDELRDEAAAAALLERTSASEGCRPQRELALLYRDGRGVGRDPARMIALLGEGCDRGDGAACVDLGFYLWIGFGAPEDHEAAEVAFLKGCELGERADCDLKRLLATPPAEPGERAIVGQLAQDPERSIAIFHVAETALPPIGAQGKLYSAMGGDRVSGWVAVAAGQITSSAPGEIRMVDTSDYRLKVNFTEGAIVALVWSEADSDSACPERLGRVTVTAEQLEIAEPITFHVGRAALREESLSLIEEIAEVLWSCSSITVEVQVHTDPRGRTDWNYWLSHDRARAIVNAIAERGVAMERMRYQGFGESCPIYTENPDPAVQRRLLRRTEIWRTDGKRPGGCAPPEPPPMPADYEKQRDLS